MLYFFLNKTLFSTGVTDNRLFVYTINSHILHSPDFDSVALITCMHELSTEAWKISLYSPLMSSKPGPISGCDVNRSTNHAGEPSLKDTTVAALEKRKKLKKGQNPSSATLHQCWTVSDLSGLTTGKQRTICLLAFSVCFALRPSVLFFRPPHAGWNDGRGAEGWGVKSITAG